MKNKKYYLIALAVIIVLGIGFLVNGQFLQGSIRKSSNVSPTPPPIPSVDVKVNGSDGPVTISSLSEVLEVSWTSKNANACSSVNENLSGLLPLSGSTLMKGSEIIGANIEASGLVMFNCMNSANVWGGDAVQVLVE